jgi:uncharacterized membrane protein SirB2
MELVSKQNTVQ